MRLDMVVAAVVGTVVAVQAGTLRGGPGDEPQTEKIASLVQLLGDDGFAIREAASAELVAVGEPALPLLRHAAAAHHDLEIRWRAEQTTQAILARTLPVGTWNVKFANGVIEVCKIAADGEVVVDEPQRRSRGTVKIQGGSAVMKFDDDRVERWIRDGQRLVVEHWFPSSQFPEATPVFGIAERAP